MTTSLAIKSQCIEPEKTIFDLPSDLQYKIFELSGISIPPDLFGKSLSGFRVKYYDYEVKKSHNYFLMKKQNNSPAGIAWEKTMQAIDKGDIPPINSQLEIVGLALKTLSKGLSLIERKEVKDLWGAYSLSVKKIKAIEQIILDKSLRLLFNGTQHSHKLPRRLSENKFRKWLYNSENANIINDVTRIVINSYDKQDKMIPDEIMVFKSLVKFEFNNSKIYSIEPLKFLPELDSLSLSSNQITDISALRPLRNLTCLELDNNQITDISALRPLTNLTHLCIENNRITDISALRSLRNLIYLEINNNQITDVSPLETLGNLTTLGLSNNQITDVSPLETLENLTILGLNNIQIIDISPLGNLINLSFLYLEDNQITDISALRPLRNLIILNLNNNQITDISALRPLRNLIILSLNNNQITDISALNPLRNLIDLEINNN